MCSRTTIAVELELKPKSTPTDFKVNNDSGILSVLNCSPNSIQDLIDKGFISSNFTGQTCVSVKQTYNTIVKELASRQDKLDKAFAEKMERTAKFFECAKNVTNDCSLYGGKQNG